MSYYVDDQVDKAVDLYFRHAQQNGLAVQQPGRHDCEHVGKTIYIKNGRHVLARNRVHTDGYLRRAEA
jgi:hypothetical protein